MLDCIDSMIHKKCICFVILHYNTIKETKECISSIMSLEYADSNKIVIIDNASPNGTGRLLQEEYRFNENVKVILRDQNDGFSAGNNAGCAYAVNKWNPDFLVVANNDIIFCQKDFISKIQKTYEESKFAVLGPDIYAPIRGVHQSPMAEQPPDKKRVWVTILLNQLMLWLYPVAYPVLIRYYRHMECTVQAKKYGMHQENVCLMGACMIYSKEYIDARNKIFAPETKFYYEEYIQTVWCMRHNKKIVYKPDIVVYHMEGKATESIDEREKVRIKFRMHNTLQAAKVYRKFIVSEV